MDSKGQMTIDYLISIIIFLLAMVFVFSYTSGIFTPFQSNSDEVTLIADRVSIAIVEKRMSAGDEAVPNLVNKTKINDFFADLNNDTNYQSIIDSLGMNGSYLRYDLNVTAENSSSIISAGKPIPPQINVGQTRRIVLCKDENSERTEMVILSFRVW
ncbi:MAG: hypothetical protein Q8J68_02945 [Methanolobus sp.]|uniref:DUF7287 family protein n=1 Tax=Methanolobus sp. TaxID=1874737 RepID=UPI0027319F77|nr:hypothetical protein [Methanolobus sp.]MDP2216230.1 hypothetical protein [Methanolobus sp.]